MLDFFLVLIGWFILSLPFSILAYLLALMNERRDWKWYAGRCEKYCEGRFYTITDTTERIKK